MRTYHPVVFTWVDVDVVDEHGVATKCKAMVPLKRYDNLAKKQFHDGEEYPLVILEARSRASHSFYFASVGNGFDNLPEKIAARWPTAEHLRKWLLIECGWFEEREFDCDSEINARRLATFIRTEDEYARISLHGKKVIVRRAKSQSAAAMGKKDFEDSKKAVLDLLEHFTEVPRGTLNKEARRRA